MKTIPHSTLWISIIIISLFPFSGFAQDSGKKIVDRAAFKNPPNEYMIIQYQLTPQTLKKYPEYGIGGTMAFFYNNLYPKGGSGNNRSVDQGPGSIGELVDEAQSINYNVWLADDWGYPSGMADGMVVAENSEFEGRGLTMLTLSGQGDGQVEYTLPEDLYDIFYAAIYPLIDPETDQRTNEAGELLIDISAGKSVTTNGRQFKFYGLNGPWQLRVFVRYTRDEDVQAQATMKQFGHSGRYPDLMNREAMSRFIANMHEPILAQIENPAEKVEGFYCNEPNLMQTHWKIEPDAPYACVPWNNELPAQFRKMHGYELFSVLPFLFESNHDEARRARIHLQEKSARCLSRPVFR